MFSRVVIVASSFYLTIAGAALAESVVVRPGDTLTSIAKKVSGDRDFWKELCAANKSVIGRNCNIIFPGTTLQIPQSGKAAAGTADTPQKSSSEGSKAAVAAETKSAPEAKDAKPECVAENNLITKPSDYSDNNYWKGYWQKPALEPGVSDPDGGNGAVLLRSTDSERSGDKATSGLLVAGELPAGKYTIGVWLRSTESSQAFEIGISDAYMSKKKYDVGQDWQHVTDTIDVKEPTNRLFQIKERTKENPDWEMFGVSVFKGECSYKSSAK